MKKTIFGVLLYSAFTACEQIPNNVCVIEGTLKGVKDSTVFRIYEYQGEEPYASDTLINGCFSFTIKPAPQEVQHFILMPDLRAYGFPNTWVDIYVKGGTKIEVEGKNTLLKTWNIKSDLPEQKYRTQLTENSRTLIEQQQYVQVLISDMQKRMMLERPSKEERRRMKDSIRQILRPQVDSLKNLITMNTLEVMQKMPINNVWMEELEQYGNIAMTYPDYPHTEQLRALYQRLTQEQQVSESGKRIGVLLYPPKTVKVGDTLADGDLYDLQGKLHHLAEFQGKYVLIDFWGAGCSPCLKAIPEMRHIAEEWKDALQIISISTDNEQTWRKVSEEENITWANLNDMQGTTGIYSHYGINGIPHYVIASPEGTIVHTWSGYEKGIIEDKLKEWLKK